MASLRDYLFTLPQYLLPQHFLSRVIHKLTRMNWKSEILIRTFLHFYPVHLSEALETDLTSYPNFNSFFTRALKPSARMIDLEPNSIVSPVDGKVSVLEKILEKTQFKTKGHNFRLSDLLGGDRSDFVQFLSGNFITIYLSPKDYHRIHMPVAGQLRKMIYIPGHLFAVNDYAVQVIPNLFSRNERVIAIFDTAFGPMALVLVGALFVGSIETVWAGEITPPTRKSSQIRNYPLTGAGSVFLEKGEEMGRFNMGSTVLVLFGANAVAWENFLREEEIVCMGTKIGYSNAI
ncbi:Phosphatidylserine decarboxylase proenzyme [Gammaproteobacteria bacterium]